MQAVRPQGGLGTLGFILPPTNRAGIPVKSGTTQGSTDGFALAGGGGLFDLCRSLEDLGAGALWAVDHLFWATPMSECLTSLAVAAAATRTIPIGSCVLQLPLRSPAVVARQAASIQTLSGGRFVLGVGVGTHPGEYLAAGVDFARRGSLMDGALRELRRLWSGDADGGSRYRQLPVPEPVPVWIGGSSRIAIRRAATSGDGWIPMFITADEYSKSLNYLRAETVAACRSPHDVTAAAVLFVSLNQHSNAKIEATEWMSGLFGISPKAFERHVIVGPAQHCAGEVERYLDAGAEHVAVMVADDSPIDHFAALLAAMRQSGSISPDATAGDRAALDAGGQAPPIRVANEAGAHPPMEVAHD
ncbi:MAG: LLM class flavin-dependent oxidoreductase [Actinobacteria bacterium]|nr:LLM class flavin-dependent oxidoreductase [Actinomycetota bacterium]MCL5444771.1 LLM class flavin-dependent oxidoreductase [Actinomycetota bacterium]